MEELLKNNPGYTKSAWHQQGPCSNWGYDVIRKETALEREERIQKSIKRAKRAIKQREKGIKKYGDRILQLQVELNKEPVESLYSRDFTIKEILNEEHEDQS